MENYSYYAFISYNHLDEKYAKSLQYKLEHYRLPAIARKEIGEEAKLSPIFRYVSDLSLGELREQVRKELEASKFLIVICSPNSAQPNVKGEHWVNDEVRHFMNIGRTDRIIPVIVDGEPKCGDPNRECFPPALLEADILGVNWKKEKDVALQRIVAKLLSLRPDLLIQRWLKDKRRRAKRIAFGLIPAFLGLAALGLFLWDHTRTVEAYFADYVDSYGLPKGLFRLTDDEILHRENHYRFEWRGLTRIKSVHADCAPYTPFGVLGFRRILRRVVQAHSSGTPRYRNHTEYGDRPPIMDFARYENGVLREVRHGEYNGEGTVPKLLRRLVYSDSNGICNGLVRFFGETDAEPKFIRAALTSQNDASEDAASGIAQLSFMRDERGTVLQVRTLNSVGEPICDGDGIYGMHHQLDGLGRIVMKSYVNENGRLTVNRIGVSSVRYEYEPTGRNMLSATYCDASGTPVVGPHGWARCIDSFDTHDNNTRSVYYGVGGERALCAAGYSACESSFDAHGNHVSYRFLDVADRPIADRENSAFGWSREYDARGHETAFWYCDSNGKAMVSKEGWFRQEQTVDATGRLLELRHLNAEGQLMTPKDRISLARYEYDGRGNCVHAQFYDLNGKPVCRVGGYAEIKRTFDGADRIIREAIFDEKGNPATYEDGSSFTERSYDAFGNTVSIANFGADGRPVETTRGYHREANEYDKAGHLVSRRFLDKHGKLVLTADGYAEEKIVCDRRGNQITNSYQGVRGESVCTKTGIAKQASEFDEHGNVVGRWFYNADGELALHTDGNAGWRGEYDVRGNRTRIVYQGLDGLPRMTTAGYAELRQTYDDRGNVTEESYFNAEGNPCGVDGHSRVKRVYDNRGNITEEIGLDARGNRKDGKNGFCSIRYKRDAFGREITRRYYAASGRAAFDPTTGCHGYDCDYDGLGHAIALRWIGVDGKMSLHKDGNASWKAEFDADGNEVRRVYVGTNGCPVLVKDGYAEIRRQYDKRRHCLKEEYFGERGERVLAGDDHVAGYVSERDGLGYETKRSYFGTDGLPMAGRHGEYGCVAEYDQHGHQTRFYRFGKNGEKVVIEETGAFEWYAKYDAQGHELEFSYLGEDGKLILSTDGFAKRISSYDRYGNMTSCKLYDANGELVIGDRENNVAYKVSEFDALGHEIAYRFYDVTGRRCVGKDGQSGEFKTYDANGRNVSWQWIDINDRPMAINGDAAGGSRKFNSAGNVIEQCWRGVNGEIARHGDGNVGWRAEYDKKGNLVKQEFFGVGGALCPIGKSGIAVYEFKFDREGHETECMCLGVERKPCKCDEGWSRRTRQYDERGNVTREFWFDEQDNPVFVDAENEIGSEEVGYDDQGRVISQRHFNLNGEPMQYPDGGYGWNVEYDSRGNIKRWSPIGIDGKPCLIKGIAHAVYEYDAFGRKIREVRVGLDGKPVSYDGDGFAETRWKYDARGNEIFKGWYDAEGRPVLTKEGIASLRREYDEAGRLLGGQFYGSDGKLILHPEYKYASLRYLYDAAGNETAEIHYNADGAILPIGDDPAVGFILKEFDVQGRVVKEMYYGVDEEIVRSKVGICGVHNWFDDSSRIVRREFLGLNGRPAFLPGTSVAGWRKRFLQGGRRVSVTWLDKKRSPTQHPDGNFGFVNELDADGNVRKQYYVDADGRPVKLKAGYARMIVDYGTDGVAENALYLDENGQTVFPQGNHRLQEGL